MPDPRPTPLHLAWLLPLTVVFLSLGILLGRAADVWQPALTALLLSHWHFDHCSDVLPLLYRLESHAAAGGAPLHIWAPVDDASPVRKAVQGCRAAVLHDVRPGDVLTLGDTEVTVHDARHPVPAVMYRITGDGRTLCYTGDTNTAAGLEAFAEGADLLLADGLFPTAAWSEGKPHLSAALAAQLARDAHVRRLVITHLNPAIDPEGLLKEARSIRQDAELAVTGACLTL